MNFDQYFYLIILLITILITQYLDFKQHKELVAEVRKLEQKIEQQRSKLTTHNAIINSLLRDK